VTATTERIVPDRAGLYGLLFAFAGRVPDDGLAEMRTCLADGEERELADLLATAVGTGRLALTDDEAALTRAFLTTYADPALVERAPRIGQLPPSPYTFSAQDQAKDAMDTVVTEAGDLVGGVRGLWRVFRHAGDGRAQRVYLAETEPTADVVELVAEMQHALIEEGAETARVEVFTGQAPLTPYHEAALAAATLVWAVEETPLRLARAFDGADAKGGPYFRADHPTLEGPESERLLAYLRAGELILNAPGGMDDVVDPGASAAVPVGFRSDGRWIWPDAVAYYLKRHHLAPEPDLVAHVLAAPEPPGPLSRLTRHRALATLFAPTGVEPVWQAG
jgi:hypothetical protein